MHHAHHRRIARFSRFMVITAGLALCAGTLAIQTGCQRSTYAIRESGERAYSLGKYDLAQQEFEEYLNRRPSNPEVIHMLGQTYIKTGETAKARERLLVLHAMRPENDEYFATMCEGLLADRQYEELNRVLRQRTIDRGRMKDYLLLAEYAQKMGDDDQAQSALITAARVDKGMSVEPHLALAKLYIKAGDKERAIERLRNAYYCNPHKDEILQLAESLGEYVGPTFAKVPDER